MLEKLLFDQFAHTAKDWDEITDDAKETWRIVADEVRMEVLAERGITDLSMKIWNAVAATGDMPLLAVSDTEVGVVAVSTRKKLRDCIEAAGKYECLTIITTQHDWIEVVPGNDPDDQIVAYTEKFYEVLG